MTDETPAASAPPGAEMQPAEPAQTSGPAAGRGPVWAVAVLALVTAAGGGYLGWQQRELARTQDELRAAQAAQQSGGERLRADLAAQDARLGQLQSAQRDAAARFAAAEERAVEARAALEKLFAEVRGGKDLLPADEAAYLVRHAQYALHLAQDPALAVRALELADARLREHGDPKWRPAREALAAAAAKLRFQAPVDLTGVSARLRALAAGAEQLPLAREDRREPAAGTGTQSSAGWRAFLSALWEDLKGLVRIRKSSDRIPLIAPEQRYFLTQNLQLQLYGAQWAALRGDAATYRQNLETARDWLKTYYDATQPPVTAAMGELTELIAAPVTVEPPDLAPLVSLLAKAARR
jgi:uncharacterized protein HemX